MANIKKCHQCGIASEGIEICDIHYEGPHRNISFNGIVLCPWCAKRIAPMFDAIANELRQKYDLNELIHENEKLKNRIYELENKDKEEQL